MKDEVFYIQSGKISVKFSDGDELAGKLAFYLPPLWGILHRSWQSPDRFIGVAIETLPVPGIVVDLVGVAAIVALAWWAMLRLQAWRQGRFAAGYTFYIASHHTIFFVGYYLIDNVTHGWLVLNVWHNLQYILFVWLQNKRRFASGIEPAKRWLSTLCQPDKAWLYFFVCLALSSIGYLALRGFNHALGVTGLPLLMMMYMTINFHHYIVDGVIWKSKRKAAVPAAA